MISAPPITAMPLTNQPLAGLGLGRQRAVREAAHDRQALEGHTPVFRHANLDPAPPGEDVEDGFVAAHRGLAQVELAAAHNRGQLAALKILGVVGALEAAHDGQAVHVVIGIQVAVMAAMARPCAHHHADAGRDQQCRPEEIPKTEIHQIQAAQQQQAAERHQDQAAGAAGGAVTLRELEGAEDDQQHRPEAQKIAPVDNAEIVEHENEAQQDQHQPQHELWGQAKPLLFVHICSP